MEIHLLLYNSLEFGAIILSLNSSYQLADNLYIRIRYYAVKYKCTNTFAGVFYICFRSFLDESPVVIFW